MKQYIFILPFILFALTSFGQDKKDIIEKGIQSKKNYGLDITNGDKEPYLEKEEFYNSKGDLVELKEYSDKGATISNWVKYKFDSQGNQIEELVMNQKGEQKERFEFKYENGLKIEKLYYDNKNHLTKKKIFRY